MSSKFVHKSIQHDSAIKHVSGASVYIDDIPEPNGCLHAALGLSEVASGKIREVNLDKVKASKGVVAVYTIDDFGCSYDVSATHANDEPILARDIIEYHGQPVFMVVAKSRELARRAARLGQIKVDEQPSVVDIDLAIEKGGACVTAGTQFKRGELDEGFLKSPRQIKGQFYVGGQDHFYLEGQIALVEPREDGGVFVQVSSQNPTEIQHVIARLLNIGAHKVTVEVKRMGGGFGGKETQPVIFAGLAAFAAAQLGVAVKLRVDRDDDMVMTGKRHDFRIDYQVGYTHEGYLEAVQADFYARCGYASDLSGPVTDRALFHADNTYYYPCVQLTSHPLKTHTVSNTAFRGFGGPQGVIFAEKIIEDIARDLSLDPYEVRLKNLYGERGDMTPYHQRVEDNISARILAELSDQCEYKSRRADILKFNQKSSRYKKGISITPVKFGISFTATWFNQAGALVHIYQDGTVQVNHGGTEMGQGLNIKIAQIAADTLGVSLDKVVVTPTNTSKVPNTSATAASSGTDLNGMAVQDACEKLRDRLFVHLAEKYKVDRAQISCSGQFFQVGEQVVSWKSTVQSAYLDRIQLSNTGFYKTPDIAWDREKGRGNPFYYFSYGAACSEVTVDRYTGDYNINQTDILHDVGKSINPAIDLGQVEGAFVQGLGWLTREELFWDTQGRLQTHSPSTYKIPLASDIPDIFHTNLVNWAENVRPTIRRSKAVGEPPFMLANSVFFAIDMAVSSIGDESTPTGLNAPATPERVLLAMDTRDGGCLD